MLMSVGAKYQRTSRVPSCSVLSLRLTWPDQGTDRHVFLFLREISSGSLYMVKGVPKTGFGRPINMHVVAMR